MTENFTPQAVVIISADGEWTVLKDLIQADPLYHSPFGEYFVMELPIAGRNEPVLFFSGGWGKVAAAASAQYVIQRWSPKILLNMGTCGGFESEIQKGTIILAEQTLVYDIINQIGSFESAIRKFTTDIDLTWLKKPYPQPVLRTLIVSGDRDIVVEDIPRLKADYGAVAADWESGAIAWVAARNRTRCLILRGVSDLVGSSGGEAYEGNKDIFLEGTRQVFEKIWPNLPQWIARGFL
jgi:adenosylhomocysteine nucleosidase